MQNICIAVRRMGNEQRKRESFFLCKLYAMKRRENRPPYYSEFDNKILIVRENPSRSTTSTDGQSNERRKGEENKKIKEPANEQPMLFVAEKLQWKEHTEM